MFTLLDLCVSSLRRGHANLFCIVHVGYFMSCHGHGLVLMSCHVRPRHDRMSFYPHPNLKKPCHKLQQDTGSVLVLMHISPYAGGRASPGGVGPLLILAGARSSSSSGASSGSTHGTIILQRLPPMYYAKTGRRLNA